MRNLKLSDRALDTTGVIPDRDLTDYLVGMLTTLLSCKGFLAISLRLALRGLARRGATRSHKMCHYFNFETFII